MRILFSLLNCLLLVLSAAAQKQLQLTDQSYEGQIKTVLLYPANGTTSDNLLPAVAPIGQQNLVLEFDDADFNHTNYYAKIVNCLYNWEKSSLSDLDFMASYNEYPVNDYAFSSNLSLKYVHYRFQVPAVKLPGNYVLVVYRESEDDIVLSKRFMIYDNQTLFSADNRMKGIGNLSPEFQQLNFLVSYSQIEIINPYDAIHTVIRQNQRWDNADMNVSPTFIREERKELEYRYADQSRQFKAGNEFRFVDFRSLNYPGQNTGRLDRSKRPFNLSVLIDKPRRDQAYALYPDLNGNFIIENRDFRDASVSADYLFVTFMLEMEKLTTEVYVVGAFNNWQKNRDSRMSYVPGKNRYEATFLLKQGFYNYQYIADDENPMIIEGSHYETENLYEVLVYYRPFRPNTDLLVGYYLMPMNKR